MDPNLKLLISFLIGMLSGAVLVVLIYLLLMLLTIKKRSYIIEAQNKNIEQEQVQKLIDQYKESYKFAHKSDNDVIKQDAFKRNVLCLAEDIARLFFPDSKRPLAELTVDELLKVNRYITERIDEIIDRPGLRFLKKLSLNTIIDLTHAKKTIEESKPVEVAKKYKAKKVFKGILMALNVINPIYWFKRLVIDNVISLVLEKIKLNIISISGQEIYKVYSKKAFQNEEENMEDLTDLENQIKDAEKAK